MHELPLVFFTVFTQIAVGAFILLLIGGAMGLVALRRKAIGPVLGDVPVWDWRHCRSFPCRTTAARAEYAVARWTFADEQRDCVVGGFLRRSAVWAH
ncbi:dimethyl sulfoxide reductase subunit C [Salmonella enterica subsp. arizonae]|uniref:Dimethyl sulfoxide reductase subunit C n=1 Tax=Salmonella enterica subsp. arizonae TaxID=59203 RepID=A0A379T465_SALER|nr:dimethyl sulfoxide reductase subunit C [Salmonella enterica subsp. arizonae]